MNNIEIRNSNSRIHHENNKILGKINIINKPQIRNDQKESHTILSFNSNFINRPSDKFSKKASDPFSVGKKQKSNFVYVYTAGGIPCRIIHGNVRLKLSWDIPPESILLF